MKVYALHKTLNNGWHFPITCEAVKAAVDHWDDWFSIIDNFELWWFSQLVKRGQDVKFLVIHETEPPNLFPPKLMSDDDVCRLLYDPPRFEGGKDKKHALNIFHSDSFKIVEPRNIFFKGTV